MKIKNSHIEEVKIVYDQQVYFNLPGIELKNIAFESISDVFSNKPWYRTSTKVFFFNSRSSPFRVELCQNIVKLGYHVFAIDYRGKVKRILF